jgi:hypothetical protein
MTYMDLWILCDGVDPDADSWSGCTAISKVESIGFLPVKVLCCISYRRIRRGSIEDSSHGMVYSSTAVPLKTAQLCTVVRRRPLSAALKEAMWGFSFLLRQK